jgi:DNA-binding NarL/FixJ family response regulator
VCHHQTVTTGPIDEAHDARRGGAVGGPLPAAGGVAASGEALEDRARALHLEFDYPGSMKAYERAYSAYRREGKLLAAARAARTLGWFHGSVYGEWAVYRGWIGRAVSLLEQAGADSNEDGWVLVAQAQAGSDLEDQKRLYLRALETARRCGDADLECEALASLGIMLAFSGYVSEGMARLDEALAVICAGEVKDLSVVEGVFCGLFHACERTNDVGRAEQWLRAADDYVQRCRFTAVGGYCRAYYGGILTAAGRWSEAEAELTSALSVFSDEHGQIRGNVLCRLANLRLQQGRVDEAGDLLVGLEQHEDAVRPLAAMYLARGDPELARDLLERTLAAGGFEDAVEGALLALLVDIELAAGAVEAAGQVVDRLTMLARNQSAPYLLALAALGRGKLCVVTSHGDARSCLHDALRYFVQAQLPLDAARTQLELAKALASTTPTAAIAHANAALDVFHRLRADRDADAATAVLRSLGVASRCGVRSRAELTRRETEVLELVGRGLSNAEIGERLFISPKTVEHHVGRILAKLGLPSRARAVAYALASTDRHFRP